MAGILTTNIPHAMQTQARPVPRQKKRDLVILKLSSYSSPVLLGLWGNVDNKPSVAADVLSV